MEANAKNAFSGKVRTQFSIRAGSFDRSAEWITDKALIGAHVRLAGEAIKEKNKAIEVCCGTGQVGREFIENGWDVTGIDITSEMVKEASRHFPAVVADAQRHIPFPDNSFDLAVMRQALFLMDPEKVLGETRRILKAGGVFILSQTVPFSKKDEDWLKDIHLAKQAQLKRFYTTEDIEGELGKNGFLVKEKIFLRVRESISRWMAEAPELTTDARQKVIDMVKDAPSGYKDERRVEVRAGEVFEDWNWVIFKAQALK
jgi:ubiquinone/menaquinone biosynthesis C-methylase UbiE